MNADRWHRCSQAVSAPFVVHVLAFVLAGYGKATQAAPSAPLTIGDLADAEWVASPQLAPNTKFVTYESSHFDRSTGMPVTRHVLVALADRSRTDLTSPEPIVSNAAWAPDGGAVAYVKAIAPNSFGVFIYALHAGVERLAHAFSRRPRDLVWGPKGDAIAFTMNVPSGAEEPTYSPLPPEIAESAAGRKELILDTLHFGENQWVSGWHVPTPEHLFVLRLQDSSVEQLTDGPWSVGAYEGGNQLDRGAGPKWSPDGRYIYFSALIADDADRRYREAHIHRVEIASREVATIFGDVPGSKSFFMSPAPSPDGRRVAFLGQRWSAAHRLLPNELWISAADGSDAVRLGEALELFGHSLMWSADGERVYVNADHRGYRRVIEFAVASGEGTEVRFGEQQGLSIHGAAKDGSMLFLRSTSAHPREVILAKSPEDDAPLRLTPFVSDLFSRRAVPEAREIVWRGGDGVEHRGVVYLPANYEHGRSYPVLVRFHGGPESTHSLAMRDAPHAIRARAMANEGYIVFWPNYRGDPSYGVSYMNPPANLKTYELRTEDLERGLDALREAVPFLRDRQYIEGASYGGHMAAWILGTTDRFAAGVVSHPFVNWISHAGTTDERAWTHGRFDRPFWEDAKEWLATSPLLRVADVRTPTLVIASENDARTPLTEALQLYTAIKMSGRVPARFVLLRDVGHDVTDLANAYRLHWHMRAWFEAYPPKAH